MDEANGSQDYTEHSFFELALADILDTVQAGGSVPLSKDGEIVAVVVSPEVAEAGRRALGR